ncbi:MAG: FmdB family zinc ribbon protein [Gammaproteobacteria bacterium]
MPIYEYRCEQCGHQEDALQKMSDDPLTECPACHQHALVKLVSAPNFRLKGGGWYETDFKKDNKRNLADDGGKPKADKSASDKPKDSAKASTDSKPAAKTKSSGDGGKAA